MNNYLDNPVHGFNVLVDRQDMQLGQIWLRSTCCSVKHESYLIESKLYFGNGRLVTLLPKLLITLIPSQLEGLVVSKKYK